MILPHFFLSTLLWLRTILDFKQISLFIFRFLTSVASHAIKSYSDINDIKIFHYYEIINFSESLCRLHLYVSTKSRCNHWHNVYQLVSANISLSAWLFTPIWPDNKIEKYSAVQAKSKKATFLHIFITLTRLMLLLVESSPYINLRT